MAKGGKRGGSGASKSASAATVKVQEDVWAQCDNPNCQKWRRLPPGTIIDENTPWSGLRARVQSGISNSSCSLSCLPTPTLRFRYCYMNPDEENAACEAPEEVRCMSLLLCRKLFRSNLSHRLASWLSAKYSVDMPSKLVVACSVYVSCCKGAEAAVSARALGSSGCMLTDMPLLDLWQNSCLYIQHLLPRQSYCEHACRAIDWTLSWSQDTKN